MADGRVRPLCISEGNVSDHLLRRRSITSNFWVPFAESLLEKGIEIRDKKNLPWIPRLRARRELKRRRADMDVSEDEDEDDEFDEDE